MCGVQHCTAQCLYAPCRASAGAVLVHAACAARAYVTPGAQGSTGVGGRGHRGMGHRAQGPVPGASADTGRWPFLAGFWPLLPGFGRFWPVLGPFFSQFRAAFVGFWPFLAGLFWPKGAKRAPYPLDLEFRQLQIFGRFLAGFWPFF